ncbi:MAG TPA: signal peptidase I [Candidatus Scybalousia intestinigallinarum]|nr:signal peptidase I [Candidatus Scybalousia intestinigallinarum]
MDGKKLKKIGLELLPYLGIILVVLLVKRFLFSTIIVHGASMEDTLHENDVMILDKISYRFSDIKRFDVIVLESGGTKLIKRVIGLPGEKIEYKDNQLYIDGNKIEDPYGNGTTYDFQLSDFNLEKIPDHYYFVLGDNREDSIDSRIIGVVSEEDIIGHARFIIFPFSRFGSVD